MIRPPSCTWYPQLVPSAAFQFPCKMGPLPNSNRSPSGLDHLEVLVYQHSSLVTLVQLRHEHLVIQHPGSACGVRWRIQTPLLLLLLSSAASFLSLGPAFTANTCPTRVSSMPFLTASWASPNSTLPFVTCNWPKHNLRPGSHLDSRE